MSPAMIAKSLPVIPNVEPPLSVYLIVLDGSKQAMIVSLTGRSRVLYWPRCCVKLLRRSSLGLKAQLESRRRLTPY